MSMKEIVSLYKDEDFKLEFVNNYIKRGESKHVAESEYVAAFRLIHKNEADGIPHVAPLYNASIESVRLVLLMISEQGIMFDPRKKEVAIFTGIQSNGVAFLDFTLRYRGIYRLVGNSPKVKATSVEVVYEGDTFEWRGSKVEPTYMMNIHHNRNKIIAGFCSFTMANDSVIAYMMSSEELYEIIGIHIKVELDNGIDTDMWSGAWLGKSLRAKIFRSAFELNKSALLDSQAMIDSVSSNEAGSEIDLFAKELEKSLIEKGV